MEIAIVVVFGLLIGSFLTVCAYRIPIAKGYHLDPLPNEIDLNEADEVVAHGEMSEGESFETLGEPVAAETDRKAEVEPIDAQYGDAWDALKSLVTPARSVCPECERQIAWYHNIPVFSWIFLGGKCAFCKSTISPQYPLLELLTAICAFLCWYKFGISPTGVALFVFCCALLVVSFIDYNYYMIPDMISFPGIVSGLLIARYNQVLPTFTLPIVPDVTCAIDGLLVGGGFLWGVAFFYERIRKVNGLGFGDVKLLAMTGAWLGWPGAFYTIFIGSFIGSIVGVLMMVLFKRSMKQMLPFGPFLAGATLVYIFSDLATTGIGAAFMDR